jgi:hypothetical protein
MAVAIIGFVLARRSPKALVSTIGRFLALAVLASVLLVAAAPAFFEQSIAMRLHLLMSQRPADDTSLSYRLDEYLYVMQEVGSRWLCGAGLGATQRTVLSIYETDPVLEQVLLRYAHNSFLWGYLKAGVLGVLGVFSLYLGYLISPIRCSRLGHVLKSGSGCVGLVAALAGLLLATWFNAHVASARYMVILAFSVAVICWPGDGLALEDPGEASVVR